MNIDAWPFLVSRNRLLGYRTVVAPDFMVEAGVGNLLANTVEEKPSGQPIYHELPKTKAGPLTLIYRIVNAANGSELYRDRSSRPILWVEGIVTKGLRKERDIPDEILQKAYEIVEQDYLEFWNSSSDSPSIKRSWSLSDSNGSSKTIDDETFVHPVNGDEAPVRYEYIKTPGLWRPVGMATSVLLVISVVLIVILIGQITARGAEVDSTQGTVTQALELLEVGDLTQKNVDKAINLLKGIAEESDNSPNQESESSQSGSDGN